MLIIAIVLLLLVGASKFFGYLQDKRATSSSYLEETARTTIKVKEMKEKRSEQIKRQEEDFGSGE